MDKKKRERPNNAMECLIYRLRKKGISIDIKNRTVFFNYLNPDQIDVSAVKRLCKEFGFGCQSRFIE